MATGLRERRKQEARQAISGVAMAMFAAKGFDEVTITQVADAAGVSKMTVTNYFPRKEDLVFDRAEVIIRSLADAAAARAPGESLLTAIRRDYADRLAAGDAVPTAAFARMVRSSHVLTTRFREIADLARAGARRHHRRRGRRGRPAAADRGGPARVGSPGAVRGRYQAHPGRPAARRDLPGAHGGCPPGL